MLIKNLENKNRELYSRYQELLEEKENLRKQLQVNFSQVINDLVSVQPMSAPVGKIFTLKYRYKT